MVTVDSEGKLVYTEATGTTTVDGDNSSYSEPLDSSVKSKFFTLSYDSSSVAPPTGDGGDTGDSGDSGDTGDTVDPIADVGTPIAVTVGVDTIGGQPTGVFYFDGVEKAVLEFEKDATYTFIQNDSSNATYGSASHPLMFSTGADGELIGNGHYMMGVVYRLDGVTVTMADYVSGFVAASDRRIEWTVPSDAPSTLFYWCHFHSGQGAAMTVTDPGDTDTGGTDGGDDTATTSINITFIGTNNHDFSTLMSAPVSLDVSTIPTADAGSTLYGSGNVAVAEFTGQDLSSTSQFGKGKVTIAQTSELAGFNLIFRYMKEDAASNAAGFSSIGPQFTIDGDALVNGAVTGDAATGMGVNSQTGFQLRVWKEAKPTSEPEPEPDPASLNFTFIGTNNHDFAPYLTMPVSLDVSTIPTAPAGSSLFASGNVAVAEFTGQDLSSTSQYGKGRVTIAQTSELAGFNLIFRYMKEDASNAEGFSSSGPQFTIDGDALVNGAVTGEADTGMGVNGQTGFQLRVWKEAK
jgi:hypothetical protein